LQNQIKELTSEHTKEVKLLQGQLVKGKEGLDKTNAAKEALKQTNNELTGQKTYLQGQIAQLNKDHEVTLQSLQEQHAAALKANDDKNVVALQNQIKELTSEHTKEVKLLQGHLVKGKEGLDKTNAAKEAFKQTNNELTGQKTYLQGQIAQLNKDHEATLQSLQEQHAAALKANDADKMDKCVKQIKECTKLSSELDEMKKEFKRIEGNASKEQQEIINSRLGDFTMKLKNILDWVNNANREAAKDSTAENYFKKLVQNALNI